MSDFDLQDLGEGRFELSGDMSFDTADQILKSSESSFGQYQGLEVDLTKVRKADSAGLALLLEWKARANQRAGEIKFIGIPDSLVAIAITSEVSELL